jgi:hypothetical protein
MIITILALTPRTRASGAMSDGWPAAAASGSMAAALEVHPRTAITTAAPAVRRVVFVIAFPPADGHEATGTLECGNARLEGEHRQKRSKNSRSSEFSVERRCRA